MSASVTIVGAGVGGLAAAVRLAHQGFSVDVYEQNDAPGGRCAQLEVEGHRFDMGPTIVLMPEVIEETFRAVGRSMGDYVELMRVSPNYRIAFRDGSNLTLGGDLALLQAEWERIEPGSFGRLLEFLALGRDMYRDSLDRFVGRNFDHIGQFLTPGNIRSMLRIRALSRLHAAVAKRFTDERLRAALTFQTMYLGISPYEAPAVYGLLPFTEMANGIYFPKGGVHALPQGLERLARELGVRFHYRQRVARIDVDDNRAKGITLSDGTQIRSDTVLCNADLPWAYENLLAAPYSRLPRKERLRYTSSGFMMYLGLRKTIPKLLHHNVFLGRGYAESFDAIFKQLRVPEDPSFYVCAPTRSDPQMAPAGRDSLYVLVPVPHQTPTIDWKREATRVREKVFARLTDEGLGDIEANIAFERQFTPDDWAGTFSLARGSAFGLSHHFSQIGPFRPSNVHSKVPNLFFVGASTQPGTGLPTVMLSAKLVAQRVAAFAERTSSAAHGVQWESPPEVSA